MHRRLFYPLFAVGLLAGCQPEPAPTAVAPVRYQPVPMPPPPVHLPSPGQAHRYSPSPAPTQARATSAIPRTWIPSAKARPWLFIVIHHSDTATGSAASFDRYHRQVKHWDSLGYHFVIGNGNGSGDGVIEVGPRWRNQAAGAHAGVEYYNERGIGICMVGDFDSAKPTPAQLRSLARLNSYLMRTYRIPAARIIPHAKVRQTSCPGRHLSIATIRQLASSRAALDGGDLLLPWLEVPQLAADELLHDISH